MIILVLTVLNSIKLEKDKNRNLIIKLEITNEYKI